MPPTQSDTNHRSRLQNSIADPFIRCVSRTIERHDMLRAGDKVLVGVSSGPDSVVLLHVLHALADRFGIGLGVAHLDHGLRPEAAEAEENLVLRMARKLDLVCHTNKLEKIPDQGSMEEQLRQLRYAFFTRTARLNGYNKIALGHHADDNAEAVLMRLLRGSGLRGLAGIPPVRDNLIIRPLIDIRRHEILAFAGRNGLRFMQDASNLDPRFERNRIRHQLIPLLERQYNPNLVRTLNRTAALCREEEDWLDSHLSSFLMQATARSNADVLELRRTSFDAAPKALQRRLIRAALRQWQGHLRRIGSIHIETLLFLLTSDQRERRVHLPYGLIAETTGMVLRFRHTVGRGEAAVPASSTRYHYSVSAAGAEPLELRIPEANILLRFSTSAITQTGPFNVPEQRMVLLDMARLNFPLIVRNFQAGDRFHPFGSPGSQKIKKLFIDRKISRLQRQRIPLLTSSDAILWVVGVRRGSEAAISPETSQVLRVSAEPL
jgi:tRNA(Ile)-lysidine synthase